MLLLCVGCTKILGIDGDYVTDENPSETGGRKATGGKSGEAGASASDGGSGGETGTGGGETAGAGGGGGTADGAGGRDGGPSLGCSTAADCGPNEKCCTGVNGVDTFCTVPEPNVGCSLLNCDRCPPPPATGTMVCNQGQCDISCNPGYVRNGDQCDPVGAGGTGGQGGSGTGGAPPPACDPKTCPGFTAAIKGCTIASPFGCCKSNQTCGCTYAVGTYCL